MDSNMLSIPEESESIVAHSIGTKKLRLAPYVLNGMILSNWDQKDMGLAVIAHSILKDYIKLCGSRNKTQVYFYDFNDILWRVGTSKSVRRLIHMALKQALQLLLPHFKSMESDSSSSAASVNTSRSATSSKSNHDRVLNIIDYISTTSGLNLISDLGIDMFQDDSFFNKLDSVPYLLGVQNGVIDLRTGDLRDRKAEDMIFTLIDVVYNISADTTLIEKTVLSAMADDEEMASFIRKLLGYGITGEVCEQILAFFTGSGGNCKGMIMKAVELVMDKFFKKAH
jgi:hypothetical protein